jgi:hypothetical protein
MVAPPKRVDSQDLNRKRLGLDSNDAWDAVKSCLIFQQMLPNKWAV